MVLELSSLQKAVLSLERALGYARARCSSNNISETELEIIQAAIVQNFEFTYELCWKFMKRWLEINVTPGYLDGATRKELFRNARADLFLREQCVVYNRVRNDY